MTVKCKSWHITFFLIPWIISLLFSSSVSAQTSLSCGQITTGSISTTSEQDTYTFSATTNDKVAIQLVRTSGDMNPYLELQDNSGAIIDYTPYTSSHYVTLTTTITTSSSYKIVVSDYGKDGTGNYSITWQKVNDPCNITTLSCGQITSGSLGVAGEQDFFSYTANSDENIIIYLVRTSGNMDPYLELYDTTGSVAASNYDTSGSSVSLNITGGNYKIAVSDYGKDETGNYAITWINLKKPCNVTMLNCGEAASGALSSAAEFDFYSFDASANEKITIHLVRSSGNMNPQLELYDSTGTRTAFNYTTTGNEAIIDTTVATSGSYTIMVSDYGMDETGNYAIVWQKLNEPCNVTSLECGVAVSSSLDTTSEHDFYSFSVAADDEAVVTLSRTSGNMDPYLELYDSTGTRLAYPSSTGSSVTLTQSVSAGKTYTVFASDYGNDETGNYTIKLQKKVDSCPEITLSTPNGGEVIEGGSTYKITWTTGGSQGISSQDITLSTDGGKTFSDKIATGLSGGEKSYTWSVAKTLHTTKGRIRIKVTDTSGDMAEDESDADFVILQYVTKSSVNYVYDKLNRLTQVVYKDTGTVTYTYDAVGNRKNVTITATTPSATPTPLPTATPTAKPTPDATGTPARTPTPPITVTPTPTATASPTATPIVTPSPTVTATPVATPTAIASPTPTPTPSCPHDGDVNEDGKLTAKDALLAFEYVLGKTLLTSCQQSHADANGNGKVTAADALCIFKAVLNGSSPTETLSCE